MVYKTVVDLSYRSSVLISVSLGKRELSGQRRPMFQFSRESLVGYCSKSGTKPEFDIFFAKNCFIDVLN